MPSPLELAMVDLLRRVEVSTATGLTPLIFGACWLQSAYASDHAVILLAGESLRDHVTTHDLGWNPDWLLDPRTGFTARDAGGYVLTAASTPARVAGRISWDPDLPLPKVDDQTKDDLAPPSEKRRRRVAGEILILALWRRAALEFGVPDLIVPAPPIQGQTRGARFKNSLGTYLEARLPGWSFPSEVPLAEIFGLHLRKDVGNRSSDILAMDSHEPDPRLMCVISSKWSWRSDRGTEAAQMVPLNKYRPDVPYVVFTAEFVRAQDVGAESVEDRAFHLCSEWVSAWLRLYADWGSVDWSTKNLDDVVDEGSRTAPLLGFGTMESLVEGLRVAGRYR